MLLIYTCAYSTSLPCQGITWDRLGINRSLLGTFQLQLHQLPPSQQVNKNMLKLLNVFQTFSLTAVVKSTDSRKAGITKLGKSIQDIQVLAGRGATSKMARFNWQQTSHHWETQDLVYDGDLTTHVYMYITGYTTSNKSCQTDQCLPKLSHIILKAFCNSVEF